MIESKAALFVVIQENLACVQRDTWVTAKDSLENTHTIRCKQANIFQIHVYIVKLCESFHSFNANVYTYLPDKTLHKQTKKKTKT